LAAEWYGNQIWFISTDKLIFLCCFTSFVLPFMTSLTIFPAHKNGLEEISAADSAEDQI
jgi:hypothetical protein